MLASQSRKNLFRTAAVLCSFGLSLAVVAMPIVAQSNKDTGKSGDKEFNLSIGAGKTVSASDVGLPIYPGAWPHKDNADDDSAAHIWASAAGYGFKLAVVKLASKDPQDKIAVFYRRAMARYGDVLVCTAGSPRANKNGQNSFKLDCGDDHPGPGEVVLKAGTKNDQHIVGIKPNGNGSFFDLVFVQIQGVDN